MSDRIGGQLGREAPARIRREAARRREATMPNPKQPEVPEGAVEALAEYNAIEVLYGWWNDAPSREAKEGRQRQRYAQLSERVKESWREGARRQLALVAPALRKQDQEEERERMREAMEGLERFDPEKDDSGSGFALGQLDPIMVPYDHGMRGDWLRRVDVIAALDSEADRG